MRRMHTPGMASPRSMLPAHRDSYLPNYVLSKAERARHAASILTHMDYTH
jgi:hypothetical protein